MMKLALMSRLAVVIVGVSVTGQSVLAPAPLAPALQVATAPGLRCGTPQGWCWATVPGTPGAVCYCPGPGGALVEGRLF